MDKNLNHLEQVILAEIAEFNYKEYPYLKNHISHLRIKSREDTGVGRYVNFEYFNDEQLTIDNSENTFLSSERSVEINALKYGINYELNITKGRFDFLELVTNGEAWSDDYGGLRFVKY